MVAERRRLLSERSGVTHKFQIGTDAGGQPIKGYITASVYEDGALGELFVKLDRQGTTVAGFVDAWALAVSILLQTGTPLAVIVDKYRGVRFPPEGYTGNPEIPIATSPVDYVVRWLAKRFL